MAPVIHDFYIESQQHGLLRVELKEFQSYRALEFSARANLRMNPFAERRMWHVLYLIIG